MATNDTSRTATKRRVQTTGTTKRRIDRAGIAAALGASVATPIQHTMDTPLGFAAVRQELWDNLRSTGGRPGFAGAERRKIPILAPVWRLVSDAAAETAEPGFHPSAAQVATAILSVAVHHLTPELRTSAKHALKAARMMQPQRGSTGD